LPLKAALTANKPLISKTDIHAIFSTIEGVLSFHRKLKEGFEKLEEEWPCVDNIGDVFLKQVFYFQLENINLTGPRTSCIRRLCGEHRSGGKSLAILATIRQKIRSIPFRSNYFNVEKLIC
jgi:hypothetical protein